MIRRALVLAVVLAAPAAAQPIPVRLGGGLSSFTGMPFDVPIEVDWSARADRLGAFSLTLRWDPAALRMDGGSNGSFGDVSGNVDSLAQGVFRLSGANPVGAAGLVTIGVPRFTPLTAGTTTIQIELSELYASGPTFADLLAAAVVQNGLYCPARGYWGDPDLDRAAGSRDALLALSAAVGLDVSAFPEIGLADVNNDGQVRANDALIILSHSVGLDVTAFRVMRIAVGSCGTEATVTYAVAPDTGTVAVNQELAFLLSATDGTASRTMPDVFWRSSNTGVLVVLSDGRAFSVGPGTATVTGKSGLKDSATATITVVARRPTHIVDALAAGSAIRLGNSEYPFASIGEADDVAQDGDSVLVRPGRYLEDAFFDRSVVVLGQAPGVRILGRGQFSTALSFYGTATSEVRNVAIDSSSGGIWAQGLFGGPPSGLLVRDVTMADVEYGIQTSNVVTRVRNVTLVRGNTGLSASGGGADSVTNSAVADYQYGIYAEDGNLYVANATIDRPGYEGILFYGEFADSSVIVNNQISCAPAPAPFALDLYDANHRAEGNTITGCEAGVNVATFIAPPGGAFRAVVRGNTITAAPTSATSAILVYGAYRTEIAGNDVSGGNVDGDGSIQVTGNFGGRPPLARVDSNIVRNASGSGISVEDVDSLVVRGNLIEDAFPATCCFSNQSGIAVGTAHYVLRVVRNTLRRMHARAGIGIVQNDTALVVLDSNAVSLADSAAIRVDAGVISMTGNNIRNNARYGLHVAAFTGAVHEAHGGAFAGNALLGVQSDNDAVNAQQNWWGVTSGACTGGDCANVNVDYANPLTADPGGLPPLAPPVAPSLAVSLATAGTAATTATPLPDRKALHAALRAERERLVALRAEQYRAYREALERRRAEYRSAQ